MANNDGWEDLPPAKTAVQAPAANSDGWEDITPHIQQSEENGTTPSTSPNAKAPEAQAESDWKAANTPGPRGDTRMLQNFGAEHPGAIAPAAALAGSSLGVPVLATAALSGLKNYLQKPSQPVQAAEDTGKETAINAVAPEVVGGAVGMVGRGAGKVADYLQQLAMGVKKFVPGAGQAAIDAGVWGTRPGMQKAMAQAVSSAGKRIGDAVGSMDGTIDSGPVADKIRGMSDDYTTSSGYVPDQAKGVTKLINTRADQVAARGAVSPQEAQDLKLIAQKLGYSKSGSALQKISGQIPQQEALGYGEQLSKLNPDYGPANQNFSSLMPGAHALSSPESIHGVTLRDLMVGGGVSSLIHNPAYAVPAIAAERALASPLAGSLSAKGASGLAKFLQGSAGAVKVTPRLLNAINKSESSE